MLSFRKKKELKNGIIRKTLPIERNSFKKIQKIYSSDPKVRRKIIETENK